MFLRAYLITSTLVSRTRMFLVCADVLASLRYQDVHHQCGRTWIIKHADDEVVEVHDDVLRELDEDTEAPS